MKKTIFLFIGVITLLFAFNSCKKDADEDSTLTFSTLTVEQQKKNIEQSRLDLADKMTGLQQTQGFVTLTQFVNISGGSLAPALVTGFRQLSTNLVNNDVNALESFNKQMRVASNVGSDIWGTWTWNKTTQKFVKASAIVLNKTVLIFPANDLNSSTNNAVLTLLYSESNVLIPEVSPAEFYPKSISVILKVDNAEVINAQFTGSYVSDGTPTNLVQTLVVGAYNWSTTFTNTNTDVSANYTFKFNSDILLKYELGAAGSFTATQIEAIVNDSTGTKGPDDIVKSGYMSFQIMNVAVKGSITDTKSFMAEGNALKPDSIGKSYCDKQVVIMNKYLKFYVYFAAEKSKFADVEFYTAEVQKTDKSKPATLVYTSSSFVIPTVKYDSYEYDYVYNSTTNTYTLVYNFYLYKTKMVYSAQPRLVLSDGSKITDFNAYADDNFGTIIAKFQSMIQE